MILGFKLENCWEFGMQNDFHVCDAMFLNPISYDNFGMQNGFTLTYMWFDVSILGFKHGGDNGIQIHFTFSHVCFDDMNLGCKILVDFGIQIWYTICICHQQIWYAFCICRNHLILEMILLLFKLNDWWIKWHDGHGLVIRLIDYGHILIDAPYLVFLIYWMYIIHPFFHHSVVFVGLWPCFAFTICSWFVRWIDCSHEHSQTFPF